MPLSNRGMVGRQGTPSGPGRLPGMVTSDDLHRDQQELNRLLHPDQGGEPRLLPQDVPRVRELAAYWRWIDGLATYSPGMYELVGTADELLDDLAMRTLGHLSLEELRAKLAEHGYACVGL